MVAWIIRKTFANIVLFIDEAKVTVEHLYALFAVMFSWVTVSFITGCLYTCIAVFPVIGAAFASETAKGLFGQKFLWVLLLVNSVLTAVFGSVKTYMSSTYSKAIEERKATGNTGQWTQIPKP